MTVEMLLERTSSAELSEWQEYFVWREAQRKQRAKEREYDDGETIHW